MIDRNKKQIIGNWKMNGNADLITEFADAFSKDGLRSYNAEMSIAVPACYLDLANKAWDQYGVKLGAQDMATHISGAFTGEVSPLMLNDLKIGFTLLGHSERRVLFGETNQTVSDKAKNAFDHGIIPIVCVGEQEDDRLKEQHEAVIRLQLEESLEGLKQAYKDQDISFMVAYEPVWAIGTGKTATPNDVKEMHALIRKELSYLFDENCAQQTPLLYGGSVKPANASEILKTENVDGVLVGGASLKADDFLAIYKSA